MKTFSVVALSVGVLAFTSAVFTQTRGTAECALCALKAPAAKPLPALNVPPDAANLPKGRIENLMPVGMLIVLGCETCAGEAVQWALAQGSSPQDIDLALRTVAAVQKLDCFQRQFGPEIAGRMEKPLAAARQALDQATPHP